MIKNSYSPGTWGQGTRIIKGHLNVTRVFNHAIMRSGATIPRTIGFIGLGNMGLPMARNLFWKGEDPLALFDAVKSGDTIRQALNASIPGETAKGTGVQCMSSLEQVAKASSILITMLPNNDSVKSVYLDPKKGLLAHVAPGTLLIDSSTIAPVVSQQVHKAAKDAGCGFLDAPVSGGVPGAEKATLAFMVGGDAEIFEKARPVLSLMGKNIVHCGPSGMGQVSKICNNMLLAISMIGTAEVLHIGKKLGMDPSLLTRIINTSSGRCWSSEVYNPVPDVMQNVPASRQYIGGFGVPLMLKDLSLALDAANQARANVTLGAMAKQIYQVLAEHKEFKDKDFSVIYQFLEQQVKPKDQ